MGRKGGQARSAAVGKQMQDRTHKGGAVLWYLRKHAPMPVPYWSSTASKQHEEVLALMEEKGHHGEASKSTAKPRDKSEHRLKGPQRQFLHQMQLVIGSEIDEGQIETTRHNIHPEGSHVVRQSSSYQHRDNLRQNFASHTDNEREQLEAEVRAREIEVVTLQKQVEQMEHYLAATRAALARREVRLQNARPVSGRPRARSLLPGSSAHADVTANLAKVKKDFLANTGGSKFDVEDKSDLDAQRKENIMEEWQVSILRQSEIAQTMRIHVDEQAKNLQQQTVQRKSVEAALFGTNAEILRLRTKTQETEARVKRLANELKRVYTNLPEMIQKQIDSPDSIKERRKNKQHDLEDIEIAHHNEFYKYMDNEKLQDESHVCDAKIKEMDEVAKKASQLVARGKAIGEAMAPHVKTLDIALNALVDVFAKLASAGHPAGDICLKDSTTSSGSDDASGILQRASVATAALGDLIEIIRDKPIPENPLRSGARSSRKRSDAA
mmetsp:Transcript_104441/g.196659  ORF Transcript_104441/g.196659 Transcript_104441/m.196659 type:complete len:496 (-) Transcript_104441:42-1529(-)